MNKRHLSAQRAREKALFRYFNALERGDFETVAAISQQAVTDPILERMIAEVNAALAGESPSHQHVNSVQPRQRQGIEQGITLGTLSPNGQTLNHSHQTEEDNIMFTTFDDTIRKGDSHLQFLTAIAAALILIVLGAILLNMFPSPAPDFQSLAGLQATDEPYAPVIDPANFVEGVNHPYFMLTPGTTFVYEAQTEDGLERIEVTVMPETKQILGIVCVVVRDTVWVDGELVEDTFDWYAQDKDGNVWYMGEDTKEYEDGAVVTTAGSWEAGVDGAQPGFIMEAHPQVGDSYRQEYYAGEAEDMAEVLHLSETASISYGTFDEVLVTKEWSPLEPGVAEHKYYAPGVGLILEVVVEGGSGQVELVDVVRRNHLGQAENADNDDSDANDSDQNTENNDQSDNEDSDDNEANDEDNGEANNAEDERDDDSIGTPLIEAEAASLVAEAHIGSGRAEETELAYENGRWVYEVEIGTEIVTVDAINGEVLAVTTDAD
jgi:uncharacterized membrane protein YkoI